MEVTDSENHGRLQWDPLKRGARLGIKIALM